MHITDSDIEVKMGRLLQWGVTLAAAVMMAGAAVYLTRHGAEAPRYGKFHGVLPQFRTPGGIVGAMSVTPGRSMIQLGVLMMIATPVFRVMFAVVAFALERDWLYTAISGIVLSLLAYALFW